jgi:hypothetical protein
LSGLDGPQLLKNTRNYERHVKATSGDLSNLDTNTADVAMPMTAVKMDSSGRFTASLNFFFSSSTHILCMTFYFVVNASYFFLTLCSLDWQEVLYRTIY